jgi:predicted phosphoribosyltransferase
MGSKESFRDREDAGRRLAERLAGYRDEDPVVLALPRGGVPVGYEIHLSLGAPLDTLVARKFGALGREEVVALLDRAREEQDESGATGPEGRA